MKKLLSKLVGILMGFIKFAGKHQMGIQSIILWICAILYIGSKDFWFFAIPAIVLSGMSDIISELRKLNASNGES
jgi:hypothetical protein